MSELTPGCFFYNFLTSYSSPFTSGACFSPTATLKSVGRIAALQMRPLRPAAAAQFNPYSPFQGPCWPSRGSQPGGPGQMWRGESLKLCAMLE